MTSPIRLGIVGANAQRGWARDAHLPALAQNPRFAIAAVSARSQALADEAATHFGAACGYGDTMDLVRDPQVDVVIVTVRVPEHRAVVLAALGAGKHVYCEWPLGRDLAESQEMAAAVRPGQVAVIGAQALSAPAVAHAVRLVHEGAIGRPLVLRAYNSAAAWGPIVSDQAYLQDKNSGATLATIGMGHMLAVIDALAGAYGEVDARSSILYPQVAVEGIGERQARTLKDHMLVLGRHANGCVSTLEVIGGSYARPASIELLGEKGTLRLTGTVPGTCQIARLAFESSVAVPLPPEPVAPSLVGPSTNLAEVYARLAQDIDTGAQILPNFADAVRLNAVMDAIDRASESGERQFYTS